MRPKDLVGLDILVGLTYLDHDGAVLSQDQFHGTIEKASDSITWVRPSDSGKRRWIPSDPKAFRPAPAGMYTLASTGQVVDSPTLLTSWMLTPNHDEDGQLLDYDVEPNLAPLKQSRVPEEWRVSYVIKEDADRRAIEMFADEYIGRSLLLGVNYTRSNGDLRHQEQLFGTIMVVDADRGIVLSCEPDGRTFVLPPCVAWVERAPLAEYRLRSTGQVITNPDYISQITMRDPH